MAVSARSVEVLWIGRLLGAERRGEEDGVMAAKGFWDFGSGQNMIRDSRFEILSWTWFRSRTLRAQRAREMPCVVGRNPSVVLGSRRETARNPSDVDDLA
jgi:hypothetical protein